MHPILGNLRRLALYLLAWIPLAALVSYLLAAVAGLRWEHAAAIGFPLCLPYAFVCLSSWYMCRTSPPGQHGAVRLFGEHLVAGAVASGIWVAMASALAAALSRLPAFGELNQRATRTAGLLFGLGILFYLMAVALHYVLLAVEESRQAEEREMQAKILARESELRALKAQVNPHFLFNCLHSISALTSSDAAKAREMCILLGDFLRRTLGLGEKTMIALREEMTMLECYLRVEKVRFGSRLEVDEQVEPEALEGLVPPLVLQPLVENAVVHGISNLPEGGWIRVTVRRQDENLLVQVENRFDLEAPRIRRNGVGLENVRRRIEACYGSRAAMHVGNDGDCFRVALTLPLIGKEGSL
jgi:two-component system, LytTR family, sensor histidine kinase AlgZ